MSGTEIPPAAALYSEVDDIVKQQGERRHGLIHHLHTGRALPSLLIFPQRTPGKIHGGPQKADEDNADNNTDNNQTALIITVGAHTSCRNLMKITKDMPTLLWCLVLHVNSSMCNTGFKTY